MRGADQRAESGGMNTGSGRIQRRALPAAVGLAVEFVGRPVVLVELQGDDVGLAIPADGFQAHRAVIGLALHGGDERVEVWRAESVNFGNAPAGKKAIVSRG